MAEKTPREVMLDAITPDDADPADEFYAAFDVDRILSALTSAGIGIYDTKTHVAVPREPTEVQKRAAFGPIMYGGRDGPIHPDFIRQEAALVTYRAMIAAAEETPGEKDSA